MGREAGVMEKIKKQVLWTKGSVCKGRSVGENFLKF